MNIFDTIVGGQHRKVATEVKNYFEEQRIMQSSQIVKVNERVWRLAEDVDSLPQWNHPITVSDKTGKTISFIDPRSFINPDGRVRNARELPLLVERATLASIWEEDRGQYQPIMSTLAAVYGEWIVSAIRSRYAPTEREIEVIRTYLITYFYLSATTDAEWVDIRESDLSERVFRVMARELRRPTNFLDEVMGDDHYINLLKTFVSNRRADLSVTLQLMTSYLDNVSIRLDTQSLLMLVIRSSWMGFAAQDIVGVGVEYPPYILHMANQALSVGVYRRTKIGAAVESAKRQRVQVAKLAGWVKEINSEVY